MRRPPILLVGHGTRDPVGVAEFLELARRVAALLPERRVEPGFLELVEPSIEQALRPLLDDGTTSCVIAPLLLFAAGHALRDVPEAVRAALAPHSQVAWRQTGPLDPHEPLLRLSQLRLEEAVARLTPATVPALSPGETLLVWVGRGSSDPHTLAKLQGFAARRRRLFPVDPSKEFQESFGFVAAAEPNYRAALAAAAKSSAKRIVVQPHLLFHGRVFDEVREEVCRASALGPEREWAIAEPLGPHELLAQAVIAGIELCERDPVG